MLIEPNANAVTAPVPVALLQPRFPWASRRRTSLTRIAFGAVALGVLGWAFAPFVLVAIDAAHSHRIFLGVAGYYPMDGLQYLAWMRDAQHGLIRNLFGSASDGAVFLHPMWSVSGWVQATAGVGQVATMVFWKLLSAIVLVGGCARLVTRHIASERPRARLTALALALFGGLTPFAVMLWLLEPNLAGDDLARAAGDLVPAFSLWDYAPLAIALGLMPFALEGVERIVAGLGDRRSTLKTAAIGLCIAWLHPWQGETLIAVGAGLVLWRGLELRSGRRLTDDARSLPPASPRARYGSLLSVAALTAAPLIYYFVLSRIDAGWAVSEHSSVAAAEIPWEVALCCLVPLALIGLAAARHSIGDPRARGLLLWPLATGLTIAVSTSGQYRAIDGLVVPLSVLALRAWTAQPRSRRGRQLASAAVIGALAPFVFFAVGAFGHLRSRSVTQYTELAPSDVRAARLAAHSAGHEPILAPYALGTAIPALTDAPTWVGHPIWTPNYGFREVRAQMLFEGKLDANAARTFVQFTGTRAIVQPCGFTAQLEPALASLGFHEARVGCSRLYTRLP